MGLLWLVQVCAGVLLLNASACSFLLDVQQKQCQSNEDCGSRGLVGATCVDNLCQPAASSGAGTTEDRSASVSAEPAAGAESQPQVKMQLGSASKSDAGTSPALPMQAGATPPQMSATSATGAAMDVSASQPGAAGAAAASAGASEACVGAGCPECASDADCEARGMAGGHCVDMVCWAATPECSADTDCVSMGPEFEGGRCVAAQCRPNPRWRCEAPAASTSTAPKMLSVLVRDSLSLNPVPMVHIVACQKLDLTCANPVTEGTTDGSGMLSISVPGNFAGYLQQTERQDYAPAMYFLPSVLPEDGVLDPFPLLSSGAIIDALAASLGAGIDDSRGHMMLIAEDCFGMALSGVTFSSPQSDAKTVQFYVRDLLPSTSAKETAEIGNGGYLNFPAGTAVISVDRVEGMLHLTTVSVVVRPKFISVAYMRPQTR